jgi:hypothetical protein
VKWFFVNKIFWNIESISRICCTPDDGMTVCCVVSDAANGRSSTATVGLVLQSTRGGGVKWSPSATVVDRSVGHCPRAIHYSTYPFGAIPSLRSFSPQIYSQTEILIKTLVGFLIRFQVDFLLFSTYFISSSSIPNSYGYGHTFSRKRHVSYENFARTSKK